MGVQFTQNFLQKWESAKPNHPSWLQQHRRHNGVGGVKRENNNCFTHLIQRLHKKKKKKRKNPLQRRKETIIDTNEDDHEPLVIDSDSNIESHPPLTIDTDGDDDNNEITKLQELEIEEINQANNIMDFVRASQDDNDLSDDKEMKECKPLQLLWLVFRNDLAQNPDLPFFQRKLKSGKLGYQKPREQNDPTSSKLLPAKIPQQTKHNRAKNVIKLLEKMKKCC
jgi:hypothetical protein